MTAPTTTSSTDRRARLLAIKLAAIVEEQAEGAAVRPGTFALGAAVQAGDHAWVLLDDAIDDGGGLGAAIAWTLRSGSLELNLVADVPLHVAARRATQFALPIRVWALTGRQLQPVQAAGPPAPPPASAEHLSVAPTIEAAGATVVVEHGVVTGEVRGLEVCRVVDSLDGGGVRLEVGVGPHDREAFAIIHGDLPPGEALAGVVSAVAEARSAQARGHPLNRLVPERLVRWRLEQEPWLVAMESVRHAEPPVRRRGLKHRVPCVAAGRRLDGTPAVIVCSVGVDLDVIPFAADARLAAGNGSSPVETMVVLAERDLVAMTRELVAELRQQLTLVSLERP